MVAIATSTLPPPRNREGPGSASPRSGTPRDDFRHTATPRSARGSVRAYRERMHQPQSMHPFEAMAEPARRRIVDVLASGEHTAGQLAEVVGGEFRISRTAVSKHLRVLRDAGFVDVRAEENFRWHRMTPDGDLASPSRFETSTEVAAAVRVGCRHQGSPRSSREASAQVPAGAKERSGAVGPAGTARGGEPRRAAPRRRSRARCLPAS